MTSESLKTSWREKLAGSFVSPVSTSVDELVGLRDVALALSRSTKRRVRASHAGAGASKILGRGLDFAEVRAYQPGDDVRMIDWNVTARSGTAHTKLFVEEKERPYFIMIDQRASMQFATQGMYKSMMAARLAGILGWCAVAGNERVGGMVFSDDHHVEIKPSAGRRGLMALFRALEKTAPAPTATHKRAVSQATDEEYASNANLRLHKQLARLRHVVHAGSSVCILSDFNGFDEQAESALGTILQRCDVLAGQIHDPLEVAVPQGGHYAVTNGLGDGARLNISTDNANIRKHYSLQHEQRTARVEQFFTRHRGRYFDIATNSDLAEVATTLMQRTSLATA